MEIVLGVIVVLIFLIGPFCISPDTAVLAIGLTVILAVAFPPALVAVFVVDVIAIIMWFLDAPKRRHFKERMKEEKEKERRHAQWRAEEQEYKEYKKWHW